MKIKCPYCESESFDMPDVIDKDGIRLRIFYCYSCCRLFTEDQNREALKVES